MSDREEVHSASRMFAWCWNRPHHSCRIELRWIVHKGCCVMTVTRINSGVRNERRYIIHDECCVVLIAHLIAVSNRSRCT
jgi:hypothetical protein